MTDITNLPDEMRGDIISYDYIIVHHTATSTGSKIEDIEAYWERKHGGPAAHYVIDRSGRIKKVLDINKNAGSTINGRYNQRAIQIEIVGNFTNSEPNLDQLRTLHQLFFWIEEKHPGMQRIRHKDIPHAATSCGGKLNTEYLYQKPPEKVEPVVKKTVLSKGQKVLFSLSRYYSVMPNQKRYYNGKTYEADFKMNCHGDCLSTANGTKLTNAHKYKSVACPPSLKIGTKIDLEGVGVVTCNDRGGAIKGLRIDMRCGIGDNALDTWKSCPTGKRYGTIL